MLSEHWYLLNSCPALKGNKGLLDVLNRSPSIHAKRHNTRHTHVSLVPDVHGRTCNLDARRY